MKLTLDRLDLRPEYREVNCSRTKFEHFDDASQAAIVSVGSAQFREFDGRSYNAIYPPIIQREKGVYSTSDPNNDQRDWR